MISLHTASGNVRKDQNNEYHTRRMKVRREKRSPNSSVGTDFELGLCCLPARRVVLLPARGETGMHQNCWKLMIDLVPAGSSLDPWTTGSTCPSLQRIRPPGPLRDAAVLYSRSGPY